jgi:hypothetical protein
MGIAAGVYAAQQQSGTAQGSSSSSASGTSSGQQTGQQAAPAQTPPPAPQQSLGDAARAAREKQKNAPQAGKTFTNDDIAKLHAGGVSTLGTAPTQAGADDGTAAPDAKLDRKKQEEIWRKKFADAHQKLAFAQKELDVMQRELSLLQTQFYQDPNKAMQQQYNRSDITEKTDKIEAKKQEIAKLEQALTDLQDELRRAGGDPSWAY